MTRFKKLDKRKTLHYNVKVYIKGCNVFIVSKTFRHKPYRNI